MNIRSSEIEGAPSVIEEGQASFEDDEWRQGKHFVGGRKVVDLPHVGAETPDGDPPTESITDDTVAGEDLTSDPPVMAARASSD